MGDAAPADQATALGSETQPPAAAPRAETPKPPADAKVAAAAAKTAQTTPEAAINGPTSPPGADVAKEAASPQPAATPPATKSAATPNKTAAGTKPPPADGAAGAPKSPPADNATGGESGAGTAPGTPTANFRAQFRAFSRFGDPKSDGRHLTLSQSDKWLKQARVIDGKKVTTTDTGIYFKKLKLQKLGMEDYKKFLEDLAKNKKINVEEVKSKLSSCGAPGLSSLTGAAKSASTVERLTDTSRYTGAHKQRFDDTGKGKGIAGRKDVPDASGYVHGYQNRDTYDKTH